MEKQNYVGVCLWMYSWQQVIYSERALFLRRCPLRMSLDCRALRRNRFFLRSASVTTSIRIPSGSSAGKQNKLYIIHFTQVLAILTADYLIISFSCELFLIHLFKLFLEWFGWIHHNMSLIDALLRVLWCPSLLF